MEKIVQTAGRDALGEFAPAFARYNDDILFGEDWNDPCIDHKLRCIITLVALVSAGVTDSSLQYHLENAKRAGVTREEIAGVITHTAFYAGWPKAWAAFPWRRRYGLLQRKQPIPWQPTPPKCASPLASPTMGMPNISPGKAIWLPYLPARSPSLM